MKTVIVFFFVSIFSMSITTHGSINTNTPERIFAEEIIATLMQEASDGFLSLAPSLKELHQLMDQYPGVYGQFLADAKADFTIQYEKQVIPGLVHAHNEVLRKSHEIGINWSKVQITGVNVVQLQGANPELVSMAIAFSHEGRNHRLEFEQAWFIAGQFRASKFIKLS